MADEFPRAEVIGVDLAPIQRAAQLIGLLVQLEEDAAPTLDRHPVLLHDRKERLGIPHFECP